MSPEQIRALFAQLSIFGLVAAVWFVGVTLWVLRTSRRRRQLERRLQFDDGNADQAKVLRLWHDGRPVETLVRGGGPAGLWARLELLRESAGWNRSMASILGMLIGITGVVSALTVMVTGKWLLGAAVVAVAMTGFRWHLARCITQRRSLYETQLMDALDLGARSLRAGHPLSGAFRLMAEEIGAPLNAVFAEIGDQESLGVSLPTALQQAAERSRSPDMKIFATSVIIQMQSGGNLADMMDRVAWVVRDRLRLIRRARVLTVEAQLSKWILLALPIGLFVVLCLFNAAYMEPFFTTTAGTLMMVYAVVSLMLGSWAMGRMAALKY